MMTIVINFKDKYQCLLFMFFLAFVLLLGGLIKAKGKLSIPKYAWILIMLIPLTALVFVGWIVLNKTVPVNGKLAAIIYFFLHNGAFLFLYGEMVSFMQKSQRQQEELAQSRFYEAQVEMMQKSLDEIKEVRHDMRNKLTAFSKYGVAGKTQEAEKLISEIIEECCNSTSYVKSGNLVIDSIIEYKLKEAKAFNIRFQSDIIVPKELECMVSDLGVVIGNLLDNAIEAAAKTKDRWIYLKMEYNKGRLLLKMSNSYDGNIKKTGKQIVTSKKDTKNHGIGLKSVERVVQKFDGEMELSHTENVFEVTILMYLTPQKKKKERLEEVEMQKIEFIKEFDRLPKALQDWGKTAIRQITSPEKRHEAAKEVRVRIDELWDKSFIENISVEKKEAFVLSELGDAETEAERLAEKYQLKENPIRDRITGVILLVLSGMLSIYVYTIFERTMDIERYGPIDKGVYYLGYAPGGAMILIVLFTFIGLRLIFQSRKKER